SSSPARRASSSGGSSSARAATSPRWRGRGRFRPVRRWRSRAGASARPVSLASVPVRARELELDLDAFEGPFDLLLTLVLKEELAPAEVDVAEIVIAFCERLEPVDLEACGGFPLLAAALLYVQGRPAVPAGAAGPAGVGAAEAPAEAAVAAIVIAFCEGLEPADLEACGGFLVLVAALLELKARSLFPDEAAELAELEPEEAAEELARRLAEYRRAKRAAELLAE